MIISDLSSCPRCGTSRIKHVPAGISRKSQKPYSEFWLCDNQRIPCERDGRVLSWKSTKQWAFLHTDDKLSQSLA
jgi:hypothetical protein